MEKKIEDYLHLYIGCKVELSRSGAKIIDKVTPSTITMLSDINVGIKPILRPLSDMTEEEAKYFGKSPFNLRELKQHFIDSPFFTPNEFRYLLEQEFDLFGLIDFKLAIDKTKL